MPRLPLALLPLLSLAATSLPADRCAVAKQATGYACQETPGGVVLAADAGEAARLAPTRRQESCAGTAISAAWRRLMRCSRPAPPR